MRELTFKGYLLFQLKELSGCNTTSLYIFQILLLLMQDCKMRLLCTLFFIQKKI